MKNKTQKVVKNSCPRCGRSFFECVSVSCEVYMREAIIKNARRGERKRTSPFLVAGMSQNKDAAYFSAITKTIHSLLNDASTSRARANRHSATLKRGCVLPIIVAEMRGQAVADAKKQLHLAAWLRKVGK